MQRQYKNTFFFWGVMDVIAIALHICSTRLVMVYPFYSDIVHSLSYHDTGVEGVVLHVMQSPLLRYK